MVRIYFVGRKIGLAVRFPVERFRPTEIWVHPAKLFAIPVKPQFQFRMFVFEGRQEAKTIGVSRIKELDNAADLFRLLRAGG